MLRIVRQILVFLLLGALLTVLSAWAIHGVQFWRASSSPGPVVHSASNYSYINVPGMWTNDSWYATQFGHSSEEYDPDAKLSVLERPRVRSRTVSQADPAVGMDPDRVWRRHRRVQAGMPPTPDLPYTMPIGFFTRDRVGWTPGESLAFVLEYDDGPRALLRSSAESLVLFNAGWPWRSVQTGTHRVVDTTTRTLTPPISLTGGLTLWTNNAQGPLDRFALPLLPLWPGFALNTLAFAAGIAVLWYVPAGVRRVNRKRTGRCLACGYDIAGLTTCPECGTAPIRGEP